LSAGKFNALRKNFIVNDATHSAQAKPEISSDNQQGSGFFKPEAPRSGHANPRPCGIAPSVVLLLPQKQAHHIRRRAAGRDSLFFFL
jgi:hypothetical protein